MNAQSKKTTPTGVRVRNFFTSTLEGWGNNDLLMTEKSREAAKAENPDIFRVLDWEEFRTAFDGPEKVALEAKGKSRQVALWSAGAAGAGAALLALTPHFYEPLIPLAALLGIALTIFGGAFAFYHLVQHDGRQKWLANRSHAERLRQFYFQFFINNLTLTCETIADPSKFDDFHQVRQARLSAVEAKLDEDARQQPDLLIDDHDHDETWLSHTWQTEGPLPAVDSAAYGKLDDFLNRLAIQRIGIQSKYAEANRQIASNTPIARHSILDATGNVLTLLVLAMAIWGGVALIAGEGFEWPIALASAFGALGVSARLLQRGLSLRADIERYDWYAEVIKSCGTRFKSGDIKQKILALRDVEEHSYSELRQFLRAHRYESVL